MSQISHVMSCPLIDLVKCLKCLKGHKSLGSLCNVKSKSTVTQSVSQSVTRSPIELLWTAKNLKMFRKSKNVQNIWKFSENLKIVRKPENRKKKNQKIWKFSENFQKIWIFSENLKTFQKSEKFLKIFANQSGHVSSSLWSNVSEVTGL